MSAATSFTLILKDTLERVDGAVGAIFAAWDGEAVDLVTSVERDEMAILAAHYGIILGHLQSAIKLFHFGTAYEIVFQHERMELILRTIDEEYYLLVAVKGRSHLATAMREVERAAAALKREMT